MINNVSSISQLISVVILTMQKYNGYLRMWRRRLSDMRHGLQNLLKVFPEKKKELPIHYRKPQSLSFKNIFFA